MPYLRKIRIAARILSSVEVDSASRLLRLDSSSLGAGPKEATSDGSCRVGLSLRGADLVVVRADSGDVGGVDLIDVGGVDLIDGGGDLLALPFPGIESECVA
jgi:hypothetical protein